MGIDKVLPMRLRASLIAQLVKNPPAMQEKRGRIPTLVFLCFPCGLAGKESACNAGDLGSIPGLGISPAEGNDNPLQYSCLENSISRGAWWATVHWVSKSGHD